MTGTCGAMGALEHLVLQAQVGDEWAKRRVVETMVPVVKHIAKRYFPPSYTYDDTIGEGMVGLLKAIRGFRPGRGATFRTFARTCIRAQLQTDLKRMIGVRGHKLDRQVLAPPETMEHLAVDEAQATVLSGDLAECRDWLERHASDLERSCVLLWVQGYTYTEITDQLYPEHGALDEKAVDNALCRVRRKARLTQAEYEAEAKLGTARDTARELTPVN